MKQKSSAKVSYDAPPIDFSNLNLKSLVDLKHIYPKQGKRKQVVIEEPKEEKKKEKHQENENNSQVQQVTQQNIQEDDDKMDEEERQKEKERREKERQKELRGIPQIIRTVGQPVVLSTNVYKPTVDEKKQTKKQFTVQLIQSSLILSYNKIASLHNFYTIMDGVMHDCKQLQWIDLSHNSIESLDYNFVDFPHLKALYLHANQLKDISEFEKLQVLEELRALTVHGNPLDEIPNFRLYLIGILPTIKKLDSALISKKELDNALIWRNNFKMIKPPTLPKQ